MLSNAYPSLIGAKFLGLSLMISGRFVITTNDSRNMKDSILYNYCSKNRLVQTAFAVHRFASGSFLVLRM